MCHVLEVMHQTVRHRVQIREFHKGGAALFMHSTKFMCTVLADSKDEEYRLNLLVDGHEPLTNNDYRRGLADKVQAVRVLQEYNRTVLPMVHEGMLAALAPTPQSGEPKKGI
jgi:hypothetical protein